MKAEHIIWVDSFDPYPNDTWVQLDRIEAEPNDDRLAIDSIGYVVRETKHYVLLSSHKYFRTVGHTLFIPKCAIIKRKKLKL